LGERERLTGCGRGGAGTGRGGGAAERNKMSKGSGGEERLTDKKEVDKRKKEYAHFHNMRKTRGGQNKREGFINWRPAEGGKENTKKTSIKQQGRNEQEY